MIDFQTVTREFRSLITRRQELATFLGSVFAASGVFLENTLHGSLPASLVSLEEHIFFFYALLILVPSLLLSLRMARLHAGMTLNGMLYAKLMQGQTFTRRGSVERAARLNFFGVSYLQFLLANFLAAFATSVMALTLSVQPFVAVVFGLAVFLIWNGFYLRFHTKAVRIAAEKIKNEECERFNDQDWLDHIASSLEDANHGLIANLGFVGLMIFSVFEVLSGLGKVETHAVIDLSAEHILKYGPIAYTVLMLVTCMAGLVINLRLRVAVGRFSTDLDPSDQPFRPFRLTDSFLGYVMLCFFTSLAAHLTLTELTPTLPMGQRLIIDGMILVATILIEPITLIRAGRIPPLPAEPKLVLVDDEPGPQKA